MKTVICHFYNEEFLLPWWLRHHKAVFDHGIMIDYYSTDRSMEIIREICPDWEIRYTRNTHFDAAEVDKEIMNIEKILGGWRMCLNVTEFLYGNTDHLAELTHPTQYLVGNYVFVDMENPDQGQTELDHNFPLHKQCYWGYDEFVNNGDSKGGTMGRMNRSIHNYPVEYSAGRHFGRQPQSFKDLVIFYYGHASVSPPAIKRKTQIYEKISEAQKGGMSNHHTADENEARSRIRYHHRPLSRDLRTEIAPIIEHHQRITKQDW